MTRINIEDTVQKTQEDVIKIQKEMLRVKKLMAILTGCIVLSTIVAAWIITKNAPGRYAIASDGHVLDTKTSKVWLRYPGANIYLGTNENPMTEQIDQKQEIESEKAEIPQKQEIESFEEMTRDVQKPVPNK
jgi:hypothetical protein